MAILLLIVPRSLMTRFCCSIFLLRASSGLFSDYINWPTTDATSIEAIELPLELDGDETAIRCFQKNSSAYGRSKFYAKSTVLMPSGLPMHYVGAQSP